MVQERNITLGEEGCLILDFIDQMKDHEGAVIYFIFFAYFCVFSYFLVFFNDFYFFFKRFR